MNTSETEFTHQTEFEVSLCGAYLFNLLDLMRFYNASPIDTDDILAIQKLGDDVDTERSVKLRSFHNEGVIPSFGQWEGINTWDSLKEVP